MKSKKAAKKSVAKSVSKSGKSAQKPVLTARSSSPKRTYAKKSGVVAKKTASKATARKPRARSGFPRHSGPEHPAIFYRLNTLLHTVRSIAEFEDHLCTILHEIKATGAASVSLSHELAEVLEDMPSTDFTHELQALRAVLDGSGAPTR